MLAGCRFKFCFLELCGIFFFPNIFNLSLVESMDAELADIEGRLYLGFYICKRATERLSYQSMALGKTEVVRGLGNRAGRL